MDKCSAAYVFGPPCICADDSLQVGFDKGDGLLAYEHPLSLTSGVLYINAQTNVGVRGRWLYRVDGNPGIPTSCMLPVQSSKSLCIVRNRPSKLHGFLVSPEW